MSLTLLEGVLVVIVLILLTYIYFRGMHPMVEIRGNNGQPVELLNISSVEDLAKMFPNLTMAGTPYANKPVYFPNGYIVSIGTIKNPDGSPYIKIQR